MNILSSPHFHVTKSHYHHRHGPPKQPPRRVPTQLLRRRSPTVLCNSSSASGEPGSDDFVSRVLKENPSQLQPKYLIGDKLYTSKEKESLGKISSLGIFDVLKKLNPTKSHSRSESAVSGEENSVYLKDLLKEYRGKLYVPDQIFRSGLSEEEEFDRTVNELPRMSIEEFRKALSKDKVRLITSKGGKGGGANRDFVVELKEIPGDKSLHTTKWVLRLGKGEARTGEGVHVSRRIVAIFVMMTMADFCDQLFGFQDVLFDNANGRLEFSGNNLGALWPGDGKPGLWLNSISRMGAVYSLIAREEEIWIEERRRKVGGVVDVERNEDIELVLPPVFDECTKVLEAGDQIVARDLYWEAVCERGPGKAEELLVESISKNPFVGEAYVVLSQICLTEGRFEEAEKHAEKGLRLLLEWGCPWDKRTSWEGWVAWTRVLLMKAKDRSWPKTSWGILNLGLVN